eukprot:733873_1
MKSKNVMKRSGYQMILSCDGDGKYTSGGASLDDLSCKDIRCDRRKLVKPASSTFQEDRKGKEPNAIGTLLKLNCDPGFEFATEAIGAESTECQFMNAMPGWKYSKKKFKTCTRVKCPDYPQDVNRLPQLESGG